MERPKEPAGSLSPAFIHIDVDDLWAIGDCYGIPISENESHQVALDALPRLQQLFDELDIKATFFAVGRDLEAAEVAEQYRGLVAQGHAIGNHSWSHPLNFRNLLEDQIAEQITRTQDVIKTVLGVTPVGFRAPGYGASPTLFRALAKLGFRYDSSVMPGPYGWVFRFLDSRMRRKARGYDVNVHGQDARATGGGQSALLGEGKTQYSRLSDTRHPLRPFEISTEHGRLLEFPVATSPLLRMPFQAGVCMRLGDAYFRTHLAAFQRCPQLPFIFLLHAADVADFSGTTHPFFRSNPYFATPVQQKVETLSRFLTAVKQARPITLTESWLP